MQQSREYPQSLRGTISDCDEPEIVKKQHLYVVKAQVDFSAQAIVAL